MRDSARHTRRRRRKSRFLTRSPRTFWKSVADTDTWPRCSRRDTRSSASGLWWSRIYRNGSRTANTRARFGRSRRGSEMSLNCPPPLRKSTPWCTRTRSNTCTITTISFVRWRGWNPSIKSFRCRNNRSGCDADGKTASCLNTDKC